MSIFILFAIPPRRNSDNDLLRLSRVDIIQHIENSTARPSLRIARIVTITSILVRQLGKSGPGVVTDVRSMSGESRVDVVVRRGGIFFSSSDFCVEDEVRTEEVTCNSEASQY